MKMLEVNRLLSANLPMDIVPTFLAPTAGKRERIRIGILTTCARI